MINGIIPEYKPKIKKLKIKKNENFKKKNNKIIKKKKKKNKIIEIVKRKRYQ